VRHTETTHGNLTLGELDAFVDNGRCGLNCHNVPGVLFGFLRYPRGVFESSFSGSLRANYTRRCGSRANHPGRRGSRANHPGRRGSRANHPGRCGSRANHPGRRGSRTDDTGGLLPKKR